MIRTPHRVKEVLRSSATYLDEMGVPEARVDAEVLLAHVLETTRSDLMARSDEELTEESWLKFNRLVARRGDRREPIAYLVGRREFYGVSLYVSPRVLIPRPETELLVERAILLQPRRLLDVGTGSGAIAAAVLRHLPSCEITVTDVSREALNVARRNLPRSVRFRSGDAFAAVPGEEFDLVVSNPPYIPTGDLEGLQAEVKHEPREALDGGPDGLTVVRRLLRGFRAYAPRILVEIGAGQSDVLRREFPGVVFHRDLAGIERVAELC